MFIALVAAGLWQKSTTVATDPTTLCPLSGPTAITVVLVDATDGINEVQKAAVQSRLDLIIGQLREFEAVSVYSLAPAHTIPAPAFRVCRPRSPDETSDWTGNKSLARQRFEKVFKPRLRKVLAEAVAQPAESSSPIMESVQALVVSAFQPADVAAGHTLPKQLVVVSDMLENGAGGSHYARTPDFETFRESAAYQRLRSHMDGIIVQILYLGRPEAAAVQGRKHAEFWQDYFADQGARAADIYWVEG